MANKGSDISNSVGPEGADFNFLYINLIREVGNVQEISTTIHNEHVLSNCYVFTPYYV